MTRTVPASVLNEIRQFMEDRGAQGLEATAMLAGTADGAITRVVIPDQIGYRSAAGVAVEVTGLGKRQLAGALALDERWHARIHSHPAEAFHSSTDDANQAVTAEGTLSIVVPFFGLGLRRGLGACAVFVLDSGRWRATTPAHVLDVIDA